MEFVKTLTFICYDADTYYFSVRMRFKISNSKILESLIFRISENEIYIKEQEMRIGKIASGAEYRMDEQFQNFLIFEILIIFQIKKKI